MNRAPAGTEEETRDAEEAAWIARIASGEAHLYGRLVERHQRRLWWSCQRMLADPDEADEIVQEAFVRAWQRLAEFDTTRAFYPWLLTIARNRCRNALRRRRTWGLRPLDAVDPPVPATGNASAEAEDGELARALEECLDALPADQREAFELRHDDGLRYAEIAQVLDVPEGTVMSRLHRARGRMRECLEGKGQAP